jgi:hypothetical protein
VRVLTKAQQIIMDFWVMDDAKLLNILLDGMGLGTLERVDKFRCANGHTHAFQSRYIDDAKLRFSKILFIELTETLKRGVVIVIDVPGHKFASSLSAYTGGVNFDFGHVEKQFRVLSKQMANLDQHLEGCLESGIDVRIICESNPASTAVEGEYSTPDGVLRQTKTHHLQAIPLLTASCAFDVMRVPAVIRVTVGAGGAVHGPEVSEERT